MFFISVLQAKNSEDAGEFLTASSGNCKRKQQDDFDDLFDFACVVDEEKDGKPTRRAQPKTKAPRRKSGGQDVDDTDRIDGVPVVPKAKIARQPGISKA